MKITVARWQNSTGKQWIELHCDGGRYSYRGDSCSGGLRCSNDAEAIAYLENGAAGIQMRCNRNFKRTI